jgi:hypothetical protein
MGQDDRILRSRLQDFFSRQEPPPGRREALLQAAFTACMLKKCSRGLQELQRGESDRDGKNSGERNWSQALLAGGLIMRR